MSSVREARVALYALPLALSCLLPLTAAAQSGYRAKPIRLVVGQAPGGATDVVARLVAPKFGEALGQTVVVENRTGAAGSIGAAFIAKSAPDGYNLLVVSSSYAINPSLNTDLPFDPVKDLAPVTLIAEAPFLLVVHPSMPVKSVKEFVAFAKARPGALNYGSGGNGSSGHLAGELFKMLAGVDMVHVPYKGAGPALVDVMAGQVHLTFGSVLSSLGHVKNGRLRALGVTGAKRSSGAPDLPTIAEGGVKGYQTTTWYGLLAPAKTPRPLITRLNTEFVKAMKSPDIVEKMSGLGVEAKGSTAEEFAVHIRAETKKMRAAVNASGAKVE